MLLLIQGHHTESVPHWLVELENSDSVIFCEGEPGPSNSHWSGSFPVGCLSCDHFKDKESKAQSGWVTCSGQMAYKVAELAFHTRSVVLSVHCSETFVVKLRRNRKQMALLCC